MARNRKRAERRPARPQDETGTPPADADARANGSAEDEQLNELVPTSDAPQGETPEPIRVSGTDEAELDDTSAADLAPAGAGRATAVADEAGTAVDAHRAGPVARLSHFVQGSWRELQRVQWPDRRQVMQATGVVVGFVIVAGAFLGVADYLSTKLINFILK